MRVRCGPRLNPFVDGSYILLQEGSPELKFEKFSTRFPTWHEMALYKILFMHDKIT